jgi:two-component system sensor histidine kinase/response regulator
MPASSPYAAAVLLADDYPAGLLAGRLLIEYLGYAAETASSGSEAVEKALAASAPFLAVLMDVRMRDMDGFEATRMIRESERGTGRRTPIIAVTAYALWGDRERCLEAGMDDHIGKPVRPDVLARKLAALAGPERRRREP